MKVKGGALIYSLFIVLVIGTLVSLVLIMSQYSAQNVIGYQKSIQESKNIRAGLTLLLDNENTQELNSEKEIVLFENKYHKIKNKRIQWGLYEVIGTSNLSKTESKHAIIGSKRKQKTALYLTNTNRSLKLAGNSILEGTCYIPTKGVERANVTGKPYRGSKLIHGTKQVSNKTLPELNVNLFKVFDKREFDSISLWNQSIDSIFQGFNNKTMHYISSNSIKLSNQSIRGNVIIESSHSITVTANVELKNAILIAPYIQIENEYEGALQLMAKDSISVGSNVTLNYPSSLLLYDSKSVKEVTGAIKTGQNTQIFGDVIAYQKEYNYRDKISILIGSNSTIVGTVYVNGIVDLINSTVKGSVYCHLLSSKSGGSTYENTLINTTISLKQQPKEFVGGEILKDKRLVSKKVIEWL